MKIETNYALLLYLQTVEVHKFNRDCEFPAPAVPPCYFFPHEQWRESCCPMLGLGNRVIIAHYQEGFPHCRDQ